MRDKVALLRRQINYDIMNGIILQYKKFLIFLVLLIFLFAFFTRRINDYTFLKDGSGAGFWDYLIYLFCGKEEIGNLSQTNVFDIPIEWLFIHGYVLFAIATYPKVEYSERGYQFLIRAGNKWCWWIGKGVYMMVGVLLYYFCIIVAAFGFSVINGASLHSINKDICNHVIGIDVSKVTQNEILLSSCIMPVLTFLALCIAGMVISFITSNMVSLIILIGYLSASAYWCNGLLLGNYTMLLRVDKVSYVTGIMISCSIIIVFFILGYYYFNQLDVIGKQKEEIA